MQKKETVNINGTEIVFYKKDQEDFISLTDIAKVRDDNNPSQIISFWLRTYSTIEYLGLWEKLNNPVFKPHIYEGFKNESAKPHFWMSPQKWINETNAIGIISKSGRYGGGTYAHSDIAFKFAAWISAEFELYLITEFKRLKNEEQKAIGWNAKRELSKINYRIHTDAIKSNLVSGRTSSTAWHSQESCTKKNNLCSMCLKWLKKIVTDFMIKTNTPFEELYNTDANELCNATISNATVKRSNGDEGCI